MKKAYTLLKDNLALIAIIPTIIGGLSQIFFLTRISPNLVRFFSISQLISDGLFILLFLGLGLITLIPLYLNLDNDFTSNSKFFKYNLVKLLFWLILIFVSISCINSIIENYKLIGFTQLYRFLYNSYLLEFLILILVSKFFKSLDKSFLMFIFLVISINASVWCYYNMNNNYEDVLNFKKMISKMEKVECYSKTPKILYFNDKYIFIEVHQKGIKNILIKKADDLFE